MTQDPVIPHYRTLDDMTQDERDALCAQYNTTISPRRQPFEDAPWKISETVQDKKGLIQEVLALPRIGQFIKKSCAKFLSELDLKGYLTDRQMASLVRWKREFSGAAPVTAAKATRRVQDTKAQPKPKARRKQ